MCFSPDLCDSKQAHLLEIFFPRFCFWKEIFSDFPLHVLIYGLIKQSWGRGGEKGTRREQGSICPELGYVHIPPLCFKNFACHPLGNRKLPLAVVPQVFVHLPLPTAPIFPSVFHAWNNRPGQFLWAPPPSLPKTKTILNPR